MYSMSTMIIGVGNDFRRDDGAGLAVVRALEAKTLPDVKVFESDGDAAALIERWAGADKVILIDAISSGARPGTIYRFDALAQPLPTEVAFHSTHAFGVAEAIGLGRALGQLPGVLVVYAIEGKAFEAGIELSAEVERAVGEVVVRLLEEVGKW
jgi:hydrogenase maturation protease